RQLAGELNTVVAARRLLDDADERAEFLDGLGYDEKAEYCGEDENQGNGLDGGEPHLIAEHAPDDATPRAGHRPPRDGYLE
ncbi:MAG: hypothetical protein ACE5FJ_09540, partial [Gemmatimonadales bacterium]